MIYIITGFNVDNMHLFNDLYNVENVMVLGIDKILNKFSLINRIIRKINNLFKSHISYWLDFRQIGRYESYHFIIVDGALIDRPIQRIRKKFKDAKISIVLLNSFSAHSPMIKKISSEVFAIKNNDVYTYDFSDSNKYGWKYIGLNYFSKAKQIFINNEGYTYFVGALKGNRENLIINLAESLYKHDCKPIFDVHCYNKAQFDLYSGDNSINFTFDWLKYDLILKRVLSCNCIVEILQEGQQAQSIRYFEAIAYNKKLISNNPNLINLPYYNPKYMRYFHDISDIDFDWVKKKEDVEYNYKNDFSPVKLVQFILNDGNGY